MRRRGHRRCRAARRADRHVLSWWAAPPGLGTRTGVAREFVH